MKPFTRKILSASLIFIVLTITFMAWFCIDISYGDQAFGFRNFDANPALLDLYHGLTILGTLIALAILIHWGWYHRHKLATAKSRKR